MTTTATAMQMAVNEPSHVVVLEMAGLALWCILWRSYGTGTSDQCSTPAGLAGQTSPQWSRPARNGEAFRAFPVDTATLRGEPAPSTTAGSWSQRPQGRRLQASRGGASRSCQSGRWHDRGHGTKPRGNVG